MIDLTEKQFDRLVEIMNWKVGYMTSFQDVSSGDALNYKWKEVNYPVIVKSRESIYNYKDEGLSYIYDRHDRWKYKKYSWTKHPDINYCESIDSSLESILEIFYQLNVEGVCDLQIEFKNKLFASIQVETHKTHFTEAHTYYRCGSDSYVLVSELINILKTIL